MGVNCSLHKATALEVASLPASPEVFVALAVLIIGILTYPTVFYVGIAAFIVTQFIWLLQR